MTPSTTRCRICKRAMYGDSVLCRRCATDELAKCPRCNVRKIAFGSSFCTRCSERLDGEFVAGTAESGADVFARIARNNAP